MPHAVISRFILISQRIVKKLLSVEKCKRTRGSSWVLLFSFFLKLIVTFFVFINFIRLVKNVSYFLSVIAPCCCFMQTFVINIHILHIPVLTSIDKDHISLAIVSCSALCVSVVDYFISCWIHLTHFSVRMLCTHFCSSYAHFGGSYFELNTYLCCCHVSDLIDLFLLVTDWSLFIRILVHNIYIYIYIYIAFNPEQRTHAFNTFM